MAIYLCNNELNISSGTVKLGNKELPAPSQSEKKCIQFKKLQQTDCR